MNLTCPQCRTVYRIDPARVPQGGVTARCRECPAAFRVEAETTRRPGTTTTARPVETGRETKPAAPAAPSQPATAPSEPATAPSEPSTAPSEPATAPSEPSTAPSEPSTAPSEPAPAAPAFGPQDPKTRAHRLARALVSDIKVYNPDKWEKSKRQGRLRKEFRDEILKSWEEYVEQVGDEMAKKTPYFRDALNDILAGGERVF